MAPSNEKVSNIIPDDLIFDILSKLPVKSLKRFSCVCKSWANLFENLQFMTMYRNNFLSNYDDDDDDSRLLLKQSIDEHDSLFLLSSERFENRVKLDWPPPFQEYESDDISIYISGSVVNGILCLYQDNGYGLAPEIGLKVVLWNPSTEEFKVIPRGSFDCPLGVDICVDLHGFGYDPVTDDYKLLRYFCFFSDSYSYYVMGDRANAPKPFWQIYCLRSNCWRKLDVEMPTHALQIPGLDVYLNGFCHWLSFKQPNSEEVLVSFNLSDEVFHTTPFDSNGCYEVFRRRLVVLKGSITMSSMYVDTPCFDISILGELGVRESWTKLFSIGPLSCVEQPIGIGKKGDIFFSKIFKKNNDELARFNLSSQMIEEIGVKGWDEWCQIVIYKESLLPIGGINN